jgi:ribosomal protein S20
VVPEERNHVASHASALKAHRQSLKNREHNRQFRSRLRGALKDIRTAIDGKDLAGAKNALKRWSRSSTDGEQNHPQRAGR